MKFEDIKLVVEKGIATITVDRGDGRNALRPQTMSELCRALDMATEDTDVGALVLTGAGRHFSAGADYAFLEDLTRMEATAIRGQIYSVFQGAAKRLWNFPKPTIAAIRGSAITVGCELALACDVRLVSPSAQFQESWIRLGLMPPLGGLFLLPRHVGLGRAGEIILSGRPVGAEEAHRIGLATHMAADEQIEEAADALAREYRSLPPLAYRVIKEAIHRSTESSMEKEWAANIMTQTFLLATNDYREGLAAIRQRRPGDFAGN